MAAYPGVMVMLMPCHGDDDVAVAHEIVWRLTTSADWEERRLVPNDVLETEGGRWASVVLEGVCIDDVVVGVASVSSGGHRSRVTAAPEPDAMVYRAASGDSGR